MPRTRSLAWSELKIGALAVAALALASMVVVAVGGQAGFWWEQYPLKTRFDNVRGLKAGAVVRVAGVEVGKVSKVDFAGASGVQVDLDVKKRVRALITTESRASIGSLSLLGEPIIDITAAPHGTPLPDDAMIQAAPSAGQISDVAETANRGLQEATALIQDIRKGKGTVGRLFTDEALYKDVQAFVDAAENVAGYIGRGQGTLGALVKDPRAYRELQASLASLNAITARINVGEGSLGRLLKDEAFAKSLSSATFNMDTLTSRLNRGEGTAGKLLTDKELYDRVNALMGRLDGIVGRLEHGQGTAGQLLQDKQLYESMNAAVSEMRGLLSDIRRDPKKYLSVKVSIF